MSKRINWKKKVAQIPSKVQIAPRIFYEVVWQKEIVNSTGHHLYGVTDLTNRVITIKMDMPARLTLETYFHECIHALSEEYKLGLTENQVLAMEHALPYILKDNNFLKDE